jgi:hypothetical protein
MLTPKERIYVEELLDVGAGTDEDVARSLADLRRINRYLGGAAAVIRALGAELLRDGVERVSILDVGTGSADIPSLVFSWCLARGVQARVVALDISERNLRVARERLGVNPAIELLRADALNLPFAAGSFDYVIASLFLHHFREEDCVKLLVEFARVARRAIMINDLVRNLVPYYFIRFGWPLFARSFLTRHDGPVSVLRGFTSIELEEIARRAGLVRFCVERRFPYRLVLVARVD